MLRIRATGLLSGRQMTASPFSSAPVAMTSCLDEPLRLHFRLRIIRAQSEDACMWELLMPV